MFIRTYIHVCLVGEVLMPSLHTKHTMLCWCPFTPHSHTLTLTLNAGGLPVQDMEVLAACLWGLLVTPVGWLVGWLAVGQHNRKSLSIRLAAGRLCHCAWKEGDSWEEPPGSLCNLTRSMVGVYMCKCVCSLSAFLCNGILPGCALITATITQCVCTC